MQPPPQTSYARARSHLVSDPRFQLAGGGYNVCPSIYLCPKPLYVPPIFYPFGFGTRKLGKRCLSQSHFDFHTILRVFRETQSVNKEFSPRAWLSVPGARNLGRGCLGTLPIDCVKRLRLFREGVSLIACFIEIVSTPYPLGPWGRNFRMGWLRACNMHCVKTLRLFRDGVVFNKVLVVWFVLKWFMSRVFEI